MSQAAAFTGARQFGSALRSPPVICSSWSCRSGGGYSSQVHTLLGSKPSARAVADCEPKCSITAAVLMDDDYGTSHMDLSIVPANGRATFRLVETIAQRVRRLRQEKELNQTQLAALAGVDQSIISDIENGKGMKAETLMGLATALEVTPNYVMEGGTTDTKAEAEAAQLLRSMEPDARQAALGSLRGIVAAKPKSAVYVKRVHDEPPHKELQTTKRRRPPKKKTGDS